MEDESYFQNADLRYRIAVGIRGKASGQSENGEEPDSTSAGSELYAVQSSVVIDAQITCCPVEPRAGVVA